MDRTKAGVVWSVQANYNDTSSSFHGYYSNKRQGEIEQYTGETHVGNSALCNKKFGVSEDGDTFVPIDQITPTKLDSTACKRCLKIFETLN